MIKFKDMNEGKNPQVIDKIIFDLRDSYGAEEQKVVNQAYKWFADNSHRYDKKDEEIYVEMGFDFITTEGPRDEHDHFSVPGPRSINQAFVITFWKESDNSNNNDDSSDHKLTEAKTTTTEATKTENAEVVDNSNDDDEDNSYDPTTIPYVEGEYSLAKKIAESDYYISKEKLQDVLYHLGRDELRKAGVLEKGEFIKTVLSDYERIDLPKFGLHLYINKASNPDIIFIDKKLLGDNVGLFIGKGGRNIKRVSQEIGRKIVVR